MSSEFDRNLDKYAEVIVKAGLNIQPGQRLLIGPPFYEVLGTPLELAPLIRLIAKKAYQMGARFVDVMWNDDQLELVRLQYAPHDTLEEFPTWRSNAALEYGEAGDAVLILAAGNPELFKNQDVSQTTTVLRTTLKHMKPFLKLGNKKVMTIAAAPVETWADKVLPHIPSENRTAEIWDTIFDICRVKESDPVLGWHDHISRLAARCKFLNMKQFVALELKGPGTELEVGLPQKHIWGTAKMTSQNGNDFVMNIPTEEIFTLPHKDKTEGIIRMTKPLVYSGTVITGIRLTFSGGKIVKASAESNEELLIELLKTDEGVSRLGEIALVPNSSPISRTGLLFYSILIDENASSHIALGQGFRFNIEGGESMSDDEFAAAGGNQSLDHIDCMIGSEKIDVDAVSEDGSVEPLMRDGEWAFDV